MAQTVRPQYSTGLSGPAHIHETFNTSAKFQTVATVVQSLLFQFLKYFTIVSFKPTFFEPQIITSLSVSATFKHTLNSMLTTGSLKLSLVMYWVQWTAVVNHYICIHTHWTIEQTKVKQQMLYRYYTQSVWKLLQLIMK